MPRPERNTLNACETLLLTIVMTINSNRRLSDNDTHTVNHLAQLEAQSVLPAAGKSVPRVTGCDPETAQPKLALNCMEIDFDGLVYVNG